jgi:two-component system CheB/CheR fusion protein
VLSASIRRAQRDRKVVSLDGINVATAKGPRQVRVVVRAVSGNGRGDDAWSISFEPSAIAEHIAATVSDASDRGDLMTERVSTLEGELRYAKENLQATIEEMETSNEELQATNEELIASNEELQSTNEELHSVNEELYTVNAEYQAKIAELTELTADMTTCWRRPRSIPCSSTRICGCASSRPRSARRFTCCRRTWGDGWIRSRTTSRTTRLLPDLEAVLASGVTIEREVRDRSDNSYFLRILPYRNSGKIDGVVLTLIDLSALKRAQRDLVGVLEHSPAFIYLKDAGGRYLLAGRQSEEVLGVPCEQIVGKTDDQLLPAAIAGARAACERNVLASCKTEELEEQLLVRGELRTFLTVVFPLRDAHSAPYAVAGISTDITEQKRASDEARRDVQRRDQFLAMLSHELRTPLGAILNATELLERKGGDGGPSSSAHDVIRRQARHMGRLIDDLLDVGRITRQQLVLQAQIVDFRDVIRDAIDIVRRDAERKQLELCCTLPNEALTVRGDPVRLRQIATNLVVNAVSYTHAGSVHVEAGRSNGSVHLAVRDTGVGLAPTRSRACSSCSIRRRSRSIGRAAGWASA